MVGLRSKEKAEQERPFDWKALLVNSRKVFKVSEVRNQGVFSLCLERNSACTCEWVRLCVCVREREEIETKRKGRLKTGGNDSVRARVCVREWERQKERERVRRANDKWLKHAHSWYALHFIFHLPTVLCCSVFNIYGGRSCWGCCWGWGCGPPFPLQSFSLSQDLLRRSSCFGSPTALTAAAAAAAQKLAPKAERAESAR